ncbi:hypothetical protein [Paracoccus aminovorans]|uniref:hypothetical protein n=1 Tax=Paracoccus aminovorans TaxID=34004 RepID=UPI0007860482|nr:hypothetical protein [Paracoccus aminovorans]MDQ7775798.1 hypothetical protein [Paracoccus aminovorans]
MLIRIVLRVIPLICVAIFTLAVYLADTPMERARQLVRLDHPRLAWSAGLVRCPDPWGNLPVSACLYANPPRIPAPPH